ncbi:MAG: UPF0182 family protein, partial [bacterium]|nr:UPF0182 family protein [bacterium]
MRLKIIISLVVTALVILLALATSLFGIVTDWWWFSELGYLGIFTTILSAKVLIGASVTAFVFLFLWLNIFFARRASPLSSRVITFPDGKDRSRMRTIEVGRVIGRLSWPIIGLISVILGFTAAAQWETVLTFLNAVPFGTEDPQFGRDIGYYVFTLPFITAVLSIAFTMVVATTISVFMVYLALGAYEMRQNVRNVIFGRFRSVVGAARRHVSLLGFVFFALLSAHAYFVSLPRLVYSDTGPLTGASYTDVTIQIPVLQISAALALLLSFALLISSFRSFKRLFSWTLTLYIVFIIVGTWLLPWGVQKFIVQPNELVKETKFIERHIQATQSAFGLDNIVKRDLPGESTLTYSDIEENQLTIQNVRLWDRDPLLDTFGQLQEIRTYYDFISVDNDRYTIDGDYRQVLLSPRELNAASLPQRNFINEHLTFTHGYGLTLGPVNEVTPEGLPVLFVKDLPPASEVDSLKVSRPEIYYGELANDFVVTNTASKEFNYPAGEENVFTEYEGGGGVPIDSFLKRLFFSLRFQSLKLLFSNDVHEESRILFYRDIDERVRKLLPFLSFDSDPYLVVDENGGLQWIIDAYTSTDSYPYSEHVSDCRFSLPGYGIGCNKLNYIRNSVKVVVDAYSGDLLVYVSDPDDPIIQTYDKVFDGSFLPIAEMSENLKTHIRYPEDLFTFQTELYSIYHMEEPQIFYNREDQWQVPKLPGQASSDPLMRHMIMRLPEEESEEFILMLPFTPREKDNLSAWMVARNDGDSYGELVVYRFPKQTLVFGPTQIINRINQDPEISRQFSLWDQRGSEVIRGNLLVIPIKTSLLYVQPIYLRAEGGKIPELKRVIAAYNNRISMEETLDEALLQLF